MKSKGENKMETIRIVEKATDALTREERQRFKYRGASIGLTDYMAERALDELNETQARKALGAKDFAAFLMKAGAIDGERSTEDEICYRVKGFRGYGEMTKRSN